MRAVLIAAGWLAFVGLIYAVISIGKREETDDEEAEFIRQWKEKRDRKRRARKR